MLRAGAIAAVTTSFVAVAVTTVVSAAFVATVAAASLFFRGFHYAYRSCIRD